MCTLTNLRNIVNVVPCLAVLPDFREVLCDHYCPVRVHPVHIISPTFFFT